MALSPNGRKWARWEAGTQVHDQWYRNIIYSPELEDEELFDGID
jgi:hypothetical protein